MLKIHIRVMTVGHNSFLCIGWFTATCFGLNRSHSQTNRAHNKLLCKFHNTVISSLYTRLGSQLHKDIIKLYDNPKSVVENTVLYPTNVRE